MIQMMKKLISKWEIYIIHLLFLKELNLIKFQNELENNINTFFKYNNFILNSLSYFDLILYSIIFLSPIYKTIINSQNENFKNIKRWCLYQIKYYEISPDKIEKFYISKEKRLLKQHIQTNLLIRNNTIPPIKRLYSLRRMFIIKTPKCRKS